MDIYLHIDIYIHIDICIIDIYIHMDIYICIGIYTHRHMHVYKYIHMWFCCIHHWYLYIYIYQQYIYIYIWHFRKDNIKYMQPSSRKWPISLQLFWTSLSKLLGKKLMLRPHLTHLQTLVILIPHTKPSRELDARLHRRWLLSQPTVLDNWDLWI